MCRSITRPVYALPTTVEALGGTKTQTAAIRGIDRKTAHRHEIGSYDRRMKLVVACLVATACGTNGTGGEPIHGDIAMHYGSDTPQLVVGSAVMNKNKPNEMFVQIGSDTVDCSTYLDVIFGAGYPSGEFVYFSVDSTQASSDAMADVSVGKSDGNNAQVTAGSGSVTIDAVEPRVSGTVNATLTNSTIGTITVAGSFDVKRCF